MLNTRQTATREGSSCVVLMFKAPPRSKQRLAGEIGAHAAVVADLLFRCATEDLEAWPGPVCFAPAAEADRLWLAENESEAKLIEEQGAGNLGDRINRVSSKLADGGYERQIFIGIDCPELSTGYIGECDRKLDECDVVLGPARDGGVVLMATRARWPELHDLPWSTPNLMAALAARCEKAGLTVAKTAVLSDIDSAADLSAATEALADDERAARRALCNWVDANRAGLIAARA